MKRALQPVDGADGTKRRRTQDPWEEVCADLVRRLEEAEAAQEQQRRQLFVSRSESVQIIRSGFIVDPMAEIQRRIDALHATFRSNWPPGKKPWYYQLVMFDHMLVMSLRWIIGNLEEFERLKPVILGKLGLDRQFKDYNQVTPRQFGKSEGLGEGTGTLAIHLPMRAGIFAQGRRNSEQDLKMTKDAAKRKLGPEQLWRIKVDKADQFVVEIIPLDGNPEPRFSITTAYPASGDSKWVFLYCKGSVLILTHLHKV